MTFNTLKIKTLLKRLEIHTMNKKCHHFHSYIMTSKKLSSLKVKPNDKLQKYDYRLKNTSKSTIKTTTKTNQKINSHKILI